MYFSEDMKDLIKIFQDKKVNYVLVGGVAVNYYGYVRTTQDIDFLLYPSKENAKKVIDSLKDFGFGNSKVVKEFFEKPGHVLHLGVEPNRIDLLTHLIGVTNDQIFSNSEKIIFEDIQVNIISYDDLIQIKRNSKRLRDRADAEELEKLRLNKP